MAAKDKGIGKPRKDPMMDMARKITDRYRVTAREARDIVTAVSTAAKVATMPATEKITKKGIVNLKAQDVKSAVKNVGKQVKETAKAATTGKKGTTAGKASSSNYPTPGKYFESGKKRK